MAKEKVLLAYSGGLDTSVILKWLTLKGYEVVAYVANVGQDSDWDNIKEKAYKSGPSCSSRRFPPSSATPTGNSCAFVAPGFPYRLTRA